MMIMGASQKSPLVALISPAGGLITVASGTSVNCTTVTAIVNGGFTPLTYDWTDNAAAVSLQASTSVSSNIQATGTNIEHQVRVTLTVTDAKGDIATDTAIFAIVQGTPP